VFSFEILHVARVQLTQAEQRKAALKKVTDELDEAEEIVSLLRMSRILISNVHFGPLRASTGGGETDVKVARRQRSHRYAHS
jgi:hypothetical protein